MSSSVPTQLYAPPTTARSTAGPSPTTQPGRREVITTVRTRNGGARTITACRFSTVRQLRNLIVYVTHTAFTAIDSYNGADYTGK